MNLVTVTSVGLGVKGVSTLVADGDATIADVSVSVAFEAKPTSQPRTFPSESSFIAQTKCPQQSVASLPTAIKPPSIVSLTSWIPLFPGPYIFFQTWLPVES